MRHIVVKQNEGENKWICVGCSSRKPKMILVAFEGLLDAIVLCKECLTNLLTEINKVQ